MPDNQRTIDAVLRFPAVTLSREVFEAILRIPLDRFKRSRTGGVHYAQVNLPDGSSWDDLAGLVDRIGPMIEPYLQTGEISRPRIDAALYFDADKASASLLIPSAAALAIGRSGFDLEVSSYLCRAE